MGLNSSKHKTLSDKTKNQTKKPIGIALARWREGGRWREKVEYLYTPERNEVSTKNSSKEQLRRNLTILKKDLAKERKLSSNLKEDLARSNKVISVLMDDLNKADSDWEARWEIRKQKEMEMKLKSSGSSLSCPGCSRVVQRPMRLQQCMKVSRCHVNTP